MNQYEKNDKISVVNESEISAGFEKAENDQLREALKRSYAERFQMMTRLMRLGFMLKNAKIVVNNNNIATND